MKLRALDDDFRELVNDHIRSEWNGPMLVTKGNLYDSRALPGFVAVDGDILLGAVLYRIASGECEISALFSLIMSRGVGTTLIRAVIDEAKKMGCSRVWLITTNDNIHAIRYYQKRGFSLKAVYIDAFETTRKLKHGLPELGIDDIPIMHEFEFETIIQH